MDDITDHDHNAIQAVIDYWFGPVDAREDPAFISERVQTLWFAENPHVDEEIHGRFGQIHARAAAGEYDRWSATVPGRMALIILLDQFSRNMFRGSSKSFAQDAAALQLALEALELGIDVQLLPVERLFLYLPLEHSESLEHQEESIRRFEQLHADAPPGLQPFTEGSLEYAIRHKVVIEQFGRFPHRNEVLGRQSTEEELAFLHEHEYGF
jgi:uncharacterized protein (DUF924 family)